MHWGFFCRGVFKDGGGWEVTNPSPAVLCSDIEKEDMFFMVGFNIVLFIYYVLN